MVTICEWKNGNAIIIHSAYQRQTQFRETKKLIWYIISVMYKKIRYEGEAERDGSFQKSNDRFRNHTKYLTDLLQTLTNKNR